MEFFPLQMFVNGQCIDPNEKKYYPPVNYEIVNGSYILRVAVAGYQSDAINIYIDGNQLIIASNKSATVLNIHSHHYIYRGISNRSFKYIFLMDGSARIKSTHIADGILNIAIEYNVPGGGIIQIPLNNRITKDE